MSDLESCLKKISRDEENEVKGQGIRSRVEVALLAGQADQPSSGGCPRWFVYDMDFLVADKKPPLIMRMIRIYGLNRKNRVCRQKLGNCMTAAVSRRCLASVEMTGRPALHPHPHSLNSRNNAKTKTGR